MVAGLGSGPPELFEGSLSITRRKVAERTFAPVPMIRDPSLPAYSDFSPPVPPLRATQARPGAAEEGAAARQGVADPGTRTTKSPPSPHPTTPSPPLST